MHWAKLFFLLPLDNQVLRRKFDDITNENKKFRAYNEELHYSLISKSIENNYKEYLETILEKIQIDIFHKYGYKFLEKAASLGNKEIFKIILDKNPNVNGSTPFHIAAKNGNKEIVKMLLEIFQQKKLGGDS